MARSHRNTPVDDAGSTVACSTANSCWSHVSRRSRAALYASRGCIDFAFRRGRPKFCDRMVAINRVGTTAWTRPLDLRGGAWLGSHRIHAGIPNRAKCMDQCVVLGGLGVQTSGTDHTRGHGGTGVSCVTLRASLWRTDFYRCMARSHATGTRISCDGMGLGDSHRDGRCVSDFVGPPFGRATMAGD